MNLLGVLGNPVSHSRSPEIHHYFARVANLDINYEKVLVADGKFKATVEHFLSRGAAGFNITVPHKFDAFQLAGELSEAAALSQAVNTIQILPDGLIKGHNTDGPGLIADLKNNLQWDICQQRVLILGAGGAVQGILPSLLLERPASVDIYNRTMAKAQQMVGRFNDDCLTASALEDLDQHYDLVISGTSAGLASDNFSLDIPTSVVGVNSCCYDMIYAAQQTPFLQWCEQNSAAQLSDGLGMLVEQAALAFEIWFGVDTATELVITKMRAGKSLRQ
ncbi:MAG: shikimate dehydrogenase [Pseudomonadales bacterium]|nr:shikimate dehydrogenase [Pseudomonadales bacterium]